MNRETVERVMQAIDVQFQRVGFNNWDDGIAYTASVLTILVTQLADRSRLEMLFLNEPEPSPDELKAILATIGTAIGFLRRELPKLAKRTIPPERGGRPSVLGTPSQQAERVRQVLTLIGKKVPTTVALKRIAQREGISLSSMQRLWKARGDTED